MGGRWNCGEFSCDKNAIGIMYVISMQNLWRRYGFCILKQAGFVR